MVAGIGPIDAPVAYAVIVLFNRPHRLVPPYLRDQPGAIADWIGAWRRRRHPDPAGS